MILPVEHWYPVIKQRHSRRQLNNQPIKVDVLHRLQKNIIDFTPYHDVRAVLVAESPDDVFKGAVGAYGKVKGAPAYMAFIGNENSNTVQENIGYLGEALILEATHLGLGTCWIGGLFRPEIVAKQVGLVSGEKVFAVTPVGYVPEEKPLGEKLLFGFKTNHKRKGLDIITNGNINYLPAWIKTALESARLAPSAVNRQPWFFNIKDDSSVILIEDKQKQRYNIAKRLDCGIAKLHFELGALHSGVKGHWEYLAPPEVARFILD